jgi:hypothetical protein
LHDLREYCSIAPNAVFDDQSGNHTESGSQTYDSCQFLQPSDLLVGAFRALLDEAKNEIQEEVSFPVKQLLARLYRGRTAMERSKWCKGFCISQAY